MNYLSSLVQALLLSRTVDEVIKGSWFARWENNSDPE